MNDRSTIFYFHGYNSSPNTDKVSRLKQILNSDVFAFNINIDPVIALSNLKENITNALLDCIGNFGPVIFVGTSLGAWYAAELTTYFAVDQTILINPCFDPGRLLKKYNVDQNILDKYSSIGPIVFNQLYQVVIGNQDEVINYNTCNFGNARVYHYDGSHRFNGPEFDNVIKLIEKEIMLT